MTLHCCQYFHLQYRQPHSYPVHPNSTGWQAVTFVTADNAGIHKDPVTSSFNTNVSRFYLQSGETIASTTGTIPRIGNNWGVSYLINTTEYPQVHLSRRKPVKAHRLEIVRLLMILLPRSGLPGHLYGILPIPQRSPKRTSTTTELPSSI